VLLPIFGHRVTCVDKDAQKIAALAQGDMPIYEPDLDRLVAENVSGGRSISPRPRRTGRCRRRGLHRGGHASRRGDGHADLTLCVRRRARDRRLAGPLHRGGHQVDGAGRDRRRGRAHHREARPDADVAVVSNPEFLREGAAIRDFKHPDRIVVGLTDERRQRKSWPRSTARSIFNQAPIVYTSRRTAELIKYAANAFLATKITFINEIADLCEKVGADVQEIARGIGLDNRIGSKFLHAGPGFGGSCFPKDTVALIKTGQDFAAPLRIVETVAAVNDARKRAMARKVAAALGGNLRARRSRCSASPSSPTPTTCARRRRSRSSSR